MESFAPTAFLQVGVLILIIMEDTHGGVLLWNLMRTNRVLILIIMEDTHGAVSIRKRMGKKVLILIIMEDTHGGLPCADKAP